MARSEIIASRGVSGGIAVASLLTSAVLAHGAYNTYEQVEVARERAPETPLNAAASYIADIPTMFFSGIGLESPDKRTFAAAPESAASYGNAIYNALGKVGGQSAAALGFFALGAGTLVMSYRTGRVRRTNTVE